jgi:hypothetical protein
MIGDAIASVLGKFIDRAWPDPAQRAAAVQALAELEQEGEFKRLDLALAQLKISEVEATSSDPFVSRWRPFIGWICGAGFAWNFIGLPVAKVVCELTGNPIAMSPADMSEMMPVLLGMLGLGGFRTIEKLKGAT